jgi:hypothetical protein
MNQRSKLFVAAGPILLAIKVAQTMVGGHGGHRMPLHRAPPTLNPETGRFS